MDGSLTVLLQTGAAVAVGAAVTCTVLFISDLLRNVTFTDSEAGEDAALPEEVKRLPVLLRVALPLTPTFMRFVRAPMFDSIRLASRSLLMQAGLDQVVTADQFVACRVVLALFGCFFGFFMALSGSMLTGLILVFLLSFYPQVWLKKRRTLRHLEIQRALPNLLDLLTLSVEAGKDFLTAMRDILRRRKGDALGEELSRAFQEIQLGKSRRDALKELSARVQQADLSAVMTAIVQADELGVSIGQVLRIQGDQLRGKRFQRAEKLANEAPVKILIPMVIFIFPAVFLVLLAPLFLSLFNASGG